MAEKPLPFDPFPGDPRFSDPDLPTPLAIHRIRDTTLGILMAAAIDPNNQEPSDG